MQTGTFKISTMPIPTIFLICVFNAFFFFQGIDTLFFDWNETFWKSVESNQNYSWVMMASTMILTVLNAILVMLSVYYLAPAIDLNSWWRKRFKRKYK